MRLQRHKYSLNGTSGACIFLGSHSIIRTYVAKCVARPRVDTCMRSMRYESRSRCLDGAARASFDASRGIAASNLTQRTAPLLLYSCIRSVRPQSRGHSLDGASITCLCASFCTAGSHVSDRGAALLMHASM
jgi:hypothetical protein